MSKLFVFCALFLSLSVFASVEKQEFSAKGLERLKLMNGAGNTKITISTDEKAYISADKVQFGKNCSIEMGRSGKVINIKVSQKGFLNDDNCRVDFDIKVPKKISLDLKSGAGDFRVKGIEGDLRVGMGSGNTEIDAIVNNLIVKTGSGEIRAKGLQGDADIKTGSGNISLSYSKAPSVGSINITTGSGDAKVVLPNTAKIKTKFMAGSGSISSELGTSDDATFIVSMKAGSGDLKIKKSSK